MKFLMMSLFCLFSILNANDETVKFDSVQELLEWHNQQPENKSMNQEYFEDDDMVIIKFENGQIVDTIADTVIVEDEIPDEPSVESLPDATVIAIDQEDEVNQSIVDKNNSSIESLPSATIVKENQDIKIVQPVAVEDTAEDRKKPITIINYNETSSMPSKLCSSATSEKIDFWSLLDHALIKSTQLILKKHDIKITEKNIDIVRSEYYPKISLGYSGEYYHGYSRDGSSIGGTYYPGISQYRDSLDLSLSHELYRFGATDLKMQMSQKDIEIIKSELLLVQQDISNELLSYFIEVVKAQENLKFKDDMRVVLDRVIQKKWRLYESGQIAKTILLKDQLSLVTLEKEILNHKMAYIDFIKKIQILTNINMDPTTVKFKIPTPKNKDIVTFEHSAIAKNLKLKLEKKLQELELIRKDYKPTIYANSAYRFYGADNDSFTKTIENLEKNSWDVGVSLRWELFSGFKTDTSIEKAKIEVQKLVEQYRLAKLDFDSRKMKRELLKEAIDKILRVEAQILDQTCQQQDIMARLEDAGQISSIELDNIEVNKLRSELNFRLGVIDRVSETISNELII